MAGLLLVFLLYWIASLPGLHALTNQCSTTSCSSASKGTKSCSATVTKDFWAGNPVNNAPTTSPTGLIQMVPDVCEPGFEPFDGRCYSYSMGTFGAPVNVGGLNKPQALTWEAAEAMCQTFSADAYFGGCHLASINTPRENCFVYEKITGSPSFAVPTSSPTKGLIKDNRAFNDYNGCHSNNYGLGDSAQTNGVCWLGLDQKSGTEGLAYAWNDASRYDRRPYRSGGFSPWAGDETTAIINCFNSATGEMCKASSSSFYYEPNNIAGGKEDCTQIWDRTSSVGEWNDEPCANVYPYVCNKLARCLPGFYRSVVYKGMPVRRNPALVDWGIDTSYSKGLCTQCAAGTFHLQNAISNYEAICSFCPAGYHGVAGETKALCTAICPVGKYCPMGTPSSNVPLCQAGTYNPSQGKSSQDDCLVAQAGYYSVAGASAQTKCPTGRCGFPAAQTATCQNACPSGYYCLAGTGCLDQSVTVERLPQPCGSISKYSASGQSACTNALAGEYTYGQTETTRMGVLACPPGYWCSGGVQTPCPLGTYNALGSQSVPGSCQACTAGYFCPLASTSPIQQVCAPFAGNATMYYCPAGTTARLVVSNNYYSTDAAGSALTRSGQAPCTTAQICINGVAYDKLVWDSTSCSAISIAENQATPQVKTIAAVLNTNLTGYTVNYTMSNFGLAADLVASLGSGPCNPNLAGNNAPYSNKGIFALSPGGALTVTRTTFPTWLDYEPTDANGAKCPTAGVRYTATLTAQAFGQGTVTTLSCQVPIAVLDQNDDPIWTKELGRSTLYRTMAERSAVNTAVGRCDSSSAVYGCPVLHDSSMSVEVKATDQDYYSVLRYSFVLGQGSALNYLSEDDNPFRINSCSGLISMRQDRTISFLTTKTFNFTLAVQDDGNGGQFPKKTAYTTVIIYITDAPDPPVLYDSNTYNFTVKENMPADQAVGSVLAFDPDAGSTVRYALVEPVDGAAFYMDASYVIRTTATGAATIDFESSKKQYIVSVRAIDNTDLSDVKPYTITVLNTNDPPTFVNVAYFYLLENSADGSKVCASSSGACGAASASDRVQVVDVDADPVSDPTVFSLAPPSALFQIDAATGQISTKAGAMASLDFEGSAVESVSTGTGRRFTVTVVANSTGVAPAWTSQLYEIYLVDVNEAPVISATASYFALETAPVGTACDPTDPLVPSIAALDPDNADLYLRGALAPQQTVSFARDNGAVDASLHDGGVLFTVFSTGAGTAAVQTSGTLDYETAPVGGTGCGEGSDAASRCYRFRVRATDNGQAPNVAAYTWVTVRVIDVNDAPSFVAPLARAVQISENATSAQLQVGGPYSGVDAEGDALAFTVLEGSSGFGLFTLVPTSATSFVINKNAGVTFDYESGLVSYQLQVRVQDGKSSRLIGTACGLVGGVPAGCDAGSVCMAKTGPFRTEYRCYEKCSAAGAPVVPRKDTYFCDYAGLVPDGAAYSQAGADLLTVAIAITDYNDPPYIVDYDGVAGNAGCVLNGSIMVNLANSVQVPIGVLSVTDQDVTYAHAPFTFAKLDAGDAFWRTFDLDPSSGAISISPDLMGGANINPDKMLTVGQRYTAQIVVLDHYPHVPAAPRGSSSCTVSVAVVDANVRPVFQTALGAKVLPEMSALGGVVFPDVSAFDPDSGDVLTYTMSVSPYFLLQGTSVVLYNAPLDFEELAASQFQHSLVIRVQDRMGAQDVRTLYVNVTDVNEAPRFSAPALKVPIPENSTAGSVVQDLAQVCRDPDTYANGLTTFNNTQYSIRSGCAGAACPFELVGASLRLKPAGAMPLLDFEGAVKNWTLVLRATDGGDAGLFSELALTVELTDVNEPPTIVSGQAFNVDEGPGGQFLADLTQLVSDQDAADPVGKLMINVTGGDPLGVFAISNGALYVAPAAVLDYEGLRAYVLVITVEDTAHNKANGTFTVNVRNVNDVTISAVSAVGADRLSCSSATRVRITGTNFGLVSRSPAADVVVTFRRPATYADPAPPVQTATGCSVTSAANTEIQCDMPLSAGSGFLFDVAVTVAGTQIAGDKFSGFASLLRYDAPNLTAAAGVGALSTAGGGGAVVLTGTCLGGGAGVAFNASLSAFSSIEFCHYTACVALAGCAATSATSVTCTDSIPAAVGSGLRWRAKVLGQTQADYLVAGAFSPPALASSNFQLPARLPTNGVPASPFFQLAGSNFGPVGTPVDLAYFVYQSATQYRFLGCYVSTAFVEVTCTSAAAGVGQNMPAFIQIGGQLSGASPFLLSYVQPTVTAISGQGAANAKTEGGQSVDITGTNFGAVCGVPGPVGTGANCALVVATYTRGAHFVSSPATQIVYTSPLCAVISQTKLSCITAPGTGAGHVWSFTIGGVAADASANTQTTSYASPVTTGYSGAAASAAETNGGQTIVIEGTNFGPVGGAKVTAVYGDKDRDPDEFTSPHCDVTQDHVQVTCVTAPGAGSDLGWIITVDELVGRNGLTNYAAPSLASSDLAGSLDNDGGSVFVVTGLNFGPKNAPGPYLVSSTYGPPSLPSAYAAACTVLDHELLNCSAPAGAGRGFVFQVNVKGQASAVSTFSLGYTAPNVSGGLQDVAVKRTDGGSTAFVLGQGFSLCDAYSTVRVVWKENPSIAGATTKVLDVTAKRSASGLVANPACPIGPNSQVGFVVPEMNVARTAQVSVQVSSSITGETYTSPTSLQYTYDPPALDSIYAEAANRPMWSQVTVFGRNLCKSETCCQTYVAGRQVDPSDVLTHTHSKLVFLAESVGSVVVRCENVPSNSLGFTSNSPFVVGTKPQLDGVQFLTVGNETFELWGLFFGEDAPNVTMCLIPFGTSEQCYGNSSSNPHVSLEVVSHGAVACDDPARPLTAGAYGYDSTSRCYRTVVRTPALTGQHLPVSVVRGETRSVAKDTRYEFLSYMAPVILSTTGTAITNSPLPSAGADADRTITLTGSNFGVLPGTVFLGSKEDPIPCEVRDWSDAEVVCVVAVGDGANLPVNVVQSGGVSVVAPNVQVSFRPPSNLVFTQDNFRTIGGQVFYVSGSDFGRANRSVITVSNDVCVLLSSNVSMATCLFPKGEGVLWPVKLAVNGQSATALQLVSYAPPVIFSVTPDANLTTDGGVPMTIVGDNFGVDKLRLFFDQFMVSERTLDPDPSLRADPFIYPGTNHTHLKLLMPAFFGRLRMVNVSVRGQFAAEGRSISFLPPALGNVSVSLEGGGQSVPFDADVDFVFPAAAFDANSTVGLNTTARRRLRQRGRALLAVETSYGMWRSSAASVCQSSVRAQKPKPLFWTYFNEYAPNGEFRKTFVHYSEGECAGASTQTFQVTVTGAVTDLGLLSQTSAVSSCGLTRVYSERVARVSVKLIDQAALETFAALCSCFEGTMGVDKAITAACLTTQASCPLLYSLYGALPIDQSRFGAYVISNDVDIWMSETASSVGALEAKTFLVYPDTPTGSVLTSVSSLAGAVPKGPTDGCFQWESLSTFLLRARTLADNDPSVTVASVPRLCIRKALMTVSGANLGQPLTPAQLLVLREQPASLRVFFVSDDPLIAPFEASTVAGRGSQQMPCPASECFQTHKQIRFWIPFGTGKALRIRVDVGDQFSYATTRFSYSPPTIEELSPGTVRLRRSFQNADGEAVVIRGKNFGGTITPSQVLISGKVCAETSWVNGQDDADGRPYLTCTPPKDVVGPKSVLVCVANQLSFNKMFKTDGPILIAGEKLNAWSENNQYTTLYSGQLKSYSLSHCPPGKTGRLYELCTPCPDGALCRDGSFTGPSSAAGFFDTEVPVRDEATGEFTSRALEFCSNDALNVTLGEEYPDLVPRDYCNGFLACEPKAACLGESKCAVGYEYALPTCLIKRNYSESGFLNVTRATVGDNLCGVALNPYTFEYEGNDTQCRTNAATGVTVPKGSACTVGNEELCSQCTVLQDDVGAYFGACECTIPARCSLCTMGAYYRLNNECVVCPSNIPLLIAGLIILAIFLVLLGFYLQRAKVNLAFITIVIDYFQVLAIMSNTKVPWPAALRQIYSFMTVFFINIDITAPECLSPNLDYEVKWWLQMALPLAMAAILLITYVSYAAIKMVRWGAYESHVYTSHLSALIAVMIITMYYLYLIVTKKALEVFDCNPVDPDDGFLYTAFTSLQCDGGGLCRCNDPGGPQQNLFPIAILFLCLYTFGYPLYIAFVLRRSSLLVREDQYLRAYDVGYMRKTNPNCYDMRKRYSKLYYQFKPRYASFWILVLLMRKFWIAFSFIIFRGNPSFQLAVVLLVLFTSIVFQVLWRPFLSSGDNAVIMRELDAMADRSIKEPAFAEYREIQKRVQECITLNVEYNRRKKQNKTGNQLFNTVQDERGNTLGMQIVIKEGKVSRSVAMARWFTNLNTLEFILLGSAILTCLAGIMFQASAQDNRSLVKGQVEAVTYLTILITVFSITYIVFFFLAEVSPSCMSTLLSLCKKKRLNEEVEDDFYDPNISLKENPMFSAPKVEYADNRELQRELDSQQAQIKAAEAQNKRLREELRKQKQDFQLEETAKQQTTGLDSVKPSTQRKEFTQTKLNQALVGPDRQRARGGKKQAEVEDEDEFDLEPSAPKDQSFLRRVSMAFAPNSNRRKSFRPQEDV